MRYSICIIDNDIPAAGIAAQQAGIKDSELLNSSNLEFLLQEETWDDEVVKNLARSLIDAKEEGSVTPKWQVYGFTNPSLYVNAIEDSLFRSDVVIFDWEYPGGQAGSGTDSENLLKEILDRTFSLVFIFSKADKKDQIEEILAKPEFEEYKGRVAYLDKMIDGADQSAALLQKADEVYSRNFSFQVAKDFRKKSLHVMDKILSDLGKATLSDLKNYLRLDEGEPRRNLIDFIADRFREGLVASGINIPEVPPPAKGEVPASVDTELIKRIWSHRLYFPRDATITAGDEIVRRGDVIRWQGNFFLVISADCDLRRFWHKNFGSINLIPLHHLHNSNSDLREMLTVCVSPGELKGEVKHLTEKIGKISEGPFILPFLLVDEEYKDFVVMPKEFTAHKVSLHAEVEALSKGDRKDKHLKYGWWEGVEKICSISEPFQSAIIQHTFSVIGGYGVPNYPKEMKGIFDGILDAFTTTQTEIEEPVVEPIPTATPAGAA